MPDLARLKLVLVLVLALESKALYSPFETRSLEDEFWSKSRCRRAADHEFPAPVTVSQRATRAQCEQACKLVLVLVLVLESKALYYYCGNIAFGHRQRPRNISPSSPLPLKLPVECLDGRRQR